MCGCLVGLQVCGSEPNSPDSMNHTSGSILLCGRKQHEAKNSVEIRGRL